jgi:hypothetical protein
LKRNWILREERIGTMVDDLKDRAESALGSIQLSAIEENQELDEQPSLGGLAKINLKCIGLEYMVSMSH